MMLAFGFGITTDVENIRFAYLDLDQSPASRSYLATFEGSRYFVRHAPAQTQEELQLRLKSHEIEVALEVEPNFGRNLGKGDVGEITAWVDGAPTNRAESLRQYLVGVHNTFLKEQLRSSPRVFPSQAAVEIETRFAYNPTFESVYAIVPSVPAILLILIPAILMAVSIVREKELGSIINFYVTPTRRLEFLVGKQLPYIVIGMINYAVLLLIAVVVFGVPLKGSGWMLDDLHAALRDGHHGRRHARLHVHLEPGGRRLHHRDPHDPADHPVLGPASAGLDPGRQCPGLRHLVAHHLLHARQRRRLHQGPGGRRPADGRPRPGRLHPGPHRSERRGPAPPGEIA